MMPCRSRVVHYAQWKIIQSLRPARPPSLSRVTPTATAIVEAAKGIPRRLLHMPNVLRTARSEWCHPSLASFQLAGTEFAKIMEAFSDDDPANLIIQNPATQTKIKTRTPITIGDAELVACFFSSS